MAAPAPAEHHAHSTAPASPPLSSSLGAREFVFVVRTNSFLDRKKWRGPKKTKGKGKERVQARGVQTVNTLVAQRALQRLALSTAYAPPPNEATQEQETPEDSRDEEEEKEEGEELLRARVLCEDSNECLHVQFLQDGRFLVVRITLRETDAHVDSDSDDEDAEEEPVEETEGEEEDATGMHVDVAASPRVWMQVLAGQYPRRVTRVLAALLVQSAVVAVAPAFVVAPTPLPALLPALTAALQEHVRAHPTLQTFKLTTEPSLWAGQRLGGAAVALDANAYPAPAELHARVAAALSAALGLRASRDVSAGAHAALNLRVELGRAHAYATLNAHPRTREEHFKRHPKGAVTELVVFVMGEVHLKLGNRAAMINEVLRRVRYRCGRLAVWSERETMFHYLVYPAAPEHVGILVDIVRTCPGVERVWRAWRVEPELEAMAAQAVTLLEAAGAWRDVDIVIKNGAKARFASTSALKAQLAAQLAAHFAPQGRIVHSNKRGTDVVLDVRLTPHNAYLSVEAHAGVGGLPANRAQQSVVALLSGGMDSPVAAYMMMKRGAYVVLVHFQNHLQMQSAVQDKIARIAAQLTRYQDHVTLYTVPFAELQAAIIERVPGPERMLVYRRFMTLLAAQIADAYHAKFLVLGDSYSQVASQTVHNLAALYERAPKPILAPLIGMNKEETMAIARRIGTWELSALPYGDCCSFFLDAHPALHMRGERIRLDEFVARVHDPALLQRALDGASIVKFKRCEGEVTRFEVRPMRVPSIAPHWQQLLDQDAQDAVCATPAAAPAADTEHDDDAPAPPAASSTRAPTPISASTSTAAPTPAVQVRVPVAPTQPAVASASVVEEVYLDNAATTVCDARVLAAMWPYMSAHYANPSSLHAAGERARAALDAARATIAAALGASPAEIVFTSGGTESNTLALHGALRHWQRTHTVTPTAPMHVLTSAIEHASVLEPLQHFAKHARGTVALTLLKPDAHGMLAPETLRSTLAALPPGSVALVSVAHANNEIGSIQDVAALTRVAKEYGALVHVDACQSFTKVPLDVRSVPVDLVTVNAHKLHGPKGVGALFVRQGVVLEPVALGGSQEWKLRAGTSNVPGVVGFAEAVRVAEENAAKSIAHMRAMCERLWARLQERLGSDALVLNGPTLGGSRLCNNLSVQFKGCESDALLRYCARHGLCCSSASACHADVDVPSHVLLAIGCSAKQAKSTLRLTTSRFTTEQEIDRAVDVIAAFFEEQRAHKK